MISSIIYLMIGTRPDLAAAVSIISQFSANPMQKHHYALKQLLKYIKGTANYKLCLARDQDLRLIDFSDANWGEDINTRRSTTGYIFNLSGGAISWSSKRQATVALSTTEAEYMALAHATKEAIWLCTLLDELGYLPNCATTLFEDNQSAIALAKNPINHARSKHIDIQHHFIREKVESKVIDIVYMATNEMIADALTKLLVRPRLETLIAKMGLRN